MAAERDLPNRCLTVSPIAVAHRAVVREMIASLGDKKVIGDNGLTRLAPTMGRHERTRRASQVSKALGFARALNP